MSAPRDSLLPIFREFAALERKLANEGVTPLDYQRWLDLRVRLAKRLAANGRPPPLDVKDAIRMRVEFRDAKELASARLRNAKREGFFIATPFAPDIGTNLELIVHIEHTGQELTLPCVVVSNNVADGFSTKDLGMGIALKPMPDELQAELKAVLKGKGKGAPS